jgi:hypothetical protein
MLMPLAMAAMFFRIGIAGLVYRIEGRFAGACSEALLDPADGAIDELGRVADADIETPLAAACPF